MSFFNDKLFSEKIDQITQLGSILVNNKLKDNRIRRSYYAKLISFIQARSAKSSNAAFLVTDIELIIIRLIYLTDYSFEVSDPIDWDSYKKIVSVVRKEPEQIKYAVATDSKGPLCYCHALFSILFSTNWYINLIPYLTNQYDEFVPIKLISRLDAGSKKYNLSSFTAKRSNKVKNIFNSVKDSLVSLWISMNSYEWDKAITRSTKILDEIVQTLPNLKFERQNDPEELFSILASVLNAEFYFLPVVLNNLFKYYIDESGTKNIIKVEKSISYDRLSSRIDYSKEKLNLQDAIDSYFSYEKKLSRKNIPQSVLNDLPPKVDNFIEKLYIRILKLPKIFIFSLGRLDSILSSNKSLNNLDKEVDFSFNTIYEIKVHTKKIKCRVLGGIIFISSKNSYGKSGHYISIFSKGNKIFKFNDINDGKTDLEPSVSKKIERYNGIQKVYNSYKDFEEGKGKSDYELMKRNMTLVFFEQTD